MAIALINEEINRFLSSDSPQVLAIKGPWGVGKTYYWNEKLKTARNNKVLKYKKYSYVSLFGINSIDELKNLIFQQTINKSLIGEMPSVETFEQTIKDSFADRQGEKLASWVGKYTRKMPSIIDSIPMVKRYAPDFKSLSSLLISDTLICLDDFERKGNNLNAQDIMGLVSILKEQKNCKIVLILNDEAFEGDGIKFYKKYREKVIDVEINFSPTSEECCEIGLGDDENKNILKALMVKLEIKNIRVINKIKGVANIFFPLIKHLDEGVLHQSANSIVLFSWCFYNSSDENVPDYEYVKKIDFSVHGIISKNANEKEIKWRKILENYGFQDVDNFDLEISKLIENGYLDRDALVKEAEIIHEMMRHEKSKSSFRNAWKIFKDSFDDNEEVVVETIFKSFKDNIEHINISNLNSIVKLFKSLEKHGLVSEVIDYYIENKINDIDFYNIRMVYQIEELELIIFERFEEIRNSNYVRKSMEEVLNDRVYNNKRDIDDEDILSSASLEEYCQLFKNKKGEVLHDFIDELLRFSGFGHLPEHENKNKIVKNTKEALTKISTESLLNKMRFDSLYRNI